MLRILIFTCFLSQQFHGHFKFITHCSKQIHAAFHMSYRNQVVVV